ncbi:NTP transferase domain-containing protein [Nocardioides sp. TRM66260-LWL]|uniref:nucleotidyltransferase family protein n=1 Tax=Nocardioides sp. TRM66260-LWL TaxID=2874478 RepID=UPI001CC5CCEE|nr:NTP transferase domain-containing protein [Nocardioides sp. TRM66260-LWL]MBZ5734582.1 NTP transferase domain-containing protein [Nocardioides sp. TRM66260-LWL]
MSEPGSGASPQVAGLLLAAGAGRRYGRPKALVDDWLPRAVEALRDGGCAPVVVVLGAAADEARARVPDGVRVVVAEGWAEGMGASLRAGLAALPADADAVLVTLVDTPDVDARVVARVRSCAVGPHGLARAAYGGRPGHPVLLGRAHWPAVHAGAVGDRGARDVLAAAEVVAVECGDLASGVDVDEPPTEHA